MLDAYTVRKAVPRILLAVIGINLSIYLCVAMIDLTNIVGHGLGQLITAPFLKKDTFGAIGIENNAANDIAFGGIVITALVGGGLLFAPGVAGQAGLAVIGVLVPILITVALITLAVLFTIIIRQGLLIFLVIVSPVAMALFVLPGTEKYFKKWFDLFFKTLLVYPIVAAMFAISTALAAILLGTAGDSPEAIGLAKIFATIIVVFAPLVLIPFAFKLAGGAISAINNVATGKSANLAGKANQGYQKWHKDPNSAAGRYGMAQESKRIEKGLTARQLWARRPGGSDRKYRRGAAAELDRRLATEKSKETTWMKFTGQDSDVQDSLIMTEDMIQKNKQDLMERRRLTQANLERTDENGFLLDANNNIVEMVNSEGKREKVRALSNSEFDRKMQAHSLADKIGRSAANQQAAFLNGDRIKFSSPTGVQGYYSELDTAKRIFGDDAAVASAMNAHQAIAVGVGRADLASSLYGNKADPTRASSKASASQVLSGHDMGVTGSIEDALHTIRSDSKEITTDQRAQSAQFLANMLASASSPYGAGNEKNKRIVLSKRNEIEEAFKTFATDPYTQGSYLHNPMQRASNAEETRTIPDPRDPAKTIQIKTPAPSIEISGAEAAEIRLKRMSASEIDPAISGAAAAAEAAKEPPKPGE